MEARRDPSLDHPAVITWNDRTKHPRCPDRQGPSHGKRSKAPLGEAEDLGGVVEGEQKGGAMTALAEGSAQGRGAEGRGVDHPRQVAAWIAYPLRGTAKWRLGSLIHAFTSWGLSSS